MFELTHEQEDMLIRALMEPCDDCAHNWTPLFARIERIVTDALADAKPEPKHEARPPHPSTQIGRR